MWLNSSAIANKDKTSHSSLFTFSTRLRMAGDIGECGGERHEASKRRSCECTSGRRLPNPMSGQGITAVRDAVLQTRTATGVTITRHDLSVFAVPFRAAKRPRPPRDACLALQAFSGCRFDMTAAHSP